MGGIELTPILGGWRIKELDGCYVEVHEMMWNYRVVRAGKPEYEGHEPGYDRGWCFLGKTWGDFLRAVLGAATWDGEDDTKPDGWDKDVNTREISHGGRRRIEQNKRRSTG